MGGGACWKAGFCPGNRPARHHLRHYRCRRRALYAIDANSGQILWEQPDGAGSTNIFAGYSAPTVGGDGTVYLGDTSKFARALDGKTGDEIWKFEAPKIFMTSPALGRDGSLFLGGGDNKLYSLSTDTGDKQWDFEDSAGTLGIWSSAAVGTDGTVYVGGATNKLLAFDPETGAKKWQFDIQYGQARSPAIGPDGTIYVASSNKKLYAVSGETGDLLEQHLQHGFPKHRLHFQSRFGAGRHGVCWSP